jgi:hypothetical protein
MTATPPVDRAAASRLTRRAGGAGGCNPPAMLAILLARGAGGAAGAGMPRGQARWDGRARRLDGSSAAEGGTLQPARLAACLDRA